MNKIAALFVVLMSIGILAHGQAKKKTVAKPKVPTKCGIGINEKMSNKATLEQMVTWAESEKLYVICDNGKKYLLKNFEISLIIKEPYSMNDYGIGEGGMPIMARRNIKNMKDGDSLFLKNILAFDENMQEVKLPVLVVGIYAQ